MDKLWTKYGTVPNLIDAWFRRERHQRASAEADREKETRPERAGKNKNKKTL